MKKIAIFTLMVFMLGLAIEFANAQTVNNSKVRNEDDEEVIKIESPVLQTTLRVAGRNKKAIKVTKQDIKVYINGEQEQVVFFETNKIKNFIVLLDYSYSMSGRKQHRVIDFLKAMSEQATNDQHFDVYLFAEKVIKAGEFTGKNSKDIIKQIRKIKPVGETALYKSVVEVLGQIEESQKSSALVVVTDGADTASGAEMMAQADQMMSRFGTLTYLMVIGRNLSTRQNFRMSEDEAQQAAKDFQRVFESVAQVLNYEMELLEAARRIPKDAGFLVTLGVDLKDEVVSRGGMNKLEIIHKDRDQENLTYRQNFLAGNKKGGK